MLRHERACDASNKTSKERRGFGLEEVHPGEPYGRPNSPQSPKNKQTASACLIGHIWGFVAAATAVAASVLFFGGGSPLSWLLTCAPGGAWAQAPEAAPPAQVRELLKLLGEPTVRSWLEDELKRVPAKDQTRPASLSCQSALERDPGSASNRDPCGQ